MNKSVILTVLALSLACLLTAAGCAGPGDEPPVVPLVRLLPGSPGYEGDGAVYGLLNGEYLVKHQKKQTKQGKDPEGRIRIWHEEDWYAVGAYGVIKKIDTSASNIPLPAGTVKLADGDTPPEQRNEAYYKDRYSDFALNLITGLANGETYGVYRYAELSNGEAVGRYRGKLQTENVNAFANLKGLSAGQSVGLFDDGRNSVSGLSGPLNDNNHLVVLVGTGLNWTEKPQTLTANAASNPTIQVAGYDYDIVVEKLAASEGDASVAAIEEEGQQYFILTGSSDFRGYIRVTAKN